MRFSTDIVIERSVSDVYQFVRQPNNMKHWVQGFQAFRPRKGTPRRPGSLAVQVFEEPDGKTTEVQEKVLQIQPNESIRLRLTHRNMDSSVHYRFLDLGEHTKLVVDVSTQLKPKLFFLLTPFVKGPMRRQQQQDLLRLKRYLETTD